MNLDNFIARDKGTGHVSIYPTYPFFIDIDFDGNSITGWTLSSQSELYSGVDSTELIYTLNMLIDKFELTTYSDHKQDYIIIYTDNLLKVKSLLPDLYQDFSTYLVAMEYFDIRDYSDFGDKDSMLVWYEQFVDEKRAYISPSQAMRKRLLKAVGDDTTAKDIYPPTIRDYKYEREGIHGGVVYTSDSSGRVYNKPMLALDLTSAYIYGLLIEPHCMSARQSVPTTDWEYYLNNSNYGSIGTYDIEYSFMFQYIRCFKDVNGKHLKNGHNKVRMILDNIALNSFINLPHMVIHNINCLKLTEFKIDYMPEYYRNFSVKLFIDKQTLDRDTIEYKNHKRYLNSGVYGNLLVDMFKYTNKETGESASDYQRRLDKLYYRKALSPKAKVSTIPLWGVYTLSYTKKLVYDLATQLVGWRYSDTDSIYCEDTPENRAKIKAFNDDIRAKVKAFCEQFDYDYEQLKDLGTFKIEAEIDKFRSFGIKQYAYETKDGHTVMHFAGCHYDETPDNMWSESFKPRSGERVVPYLDDNNVYHEKVFGTNVLSLFVK